MPSSKEFDELDKEFEGFGNGFLQFGAGNHSKTKSKIKREIDALTSKSPASSTGVGQIIADGEDIFIQSGGDYTIYRGATRITVNTRK